MYSFWCSNWYINFAVIKIIHLKSQKIKSFDSKRLSTLVFVGPRITILWARRVYLETFKSCLIMLLFILIFSAFRVILQNYVVSVLLEKSRYLKRCYLSLTPHIFYKKQRQRLVQRLLKSISWGVTNTLLF